MEQIIKIDDSALLSKHIINKKDILGFLPESLKESVAEICILVNNGLPRWFIFLWGHGAYAYTPHSGEMEFDPYANIGQYGKIYITRKGRYMRKETGDGKITKKIFCVYLCRPHHMLLWREVKEYWVYNDEEIDGYATSCRWFRRYQK